MPAPARKDAFRKALERRIRGGVSFDAITRGIYATDASIYQVTPLAVVTPLVEADVITAVEIARSHGIPICPRGGGTSLGGQAVGEALVLDFSKHMNRVLEVNVAERWVRVEPGIVRDNLNAELAKHGLQFAPDPATTSRACIGGMIGNNSSGTKSLVFGKTVDHTLETRVLLQDGEIMHLKALSPEEYAHEAGSEGRKGEIYRTFKRIVDENRAEIEERYPKIMRRVMGYNLDEFIHTDCWNLSRLMVGSEGTLGIVLEAKLNLEPIPKCSGLCLPHFTDLLEAISAVEPILAHGPSAVEIMDASVIRLAHKNLSIAPLCEFIEGEPAAILIVEFFGETAEEVESKEKKLIEDLRAQGIGYTHPVRNDGAGKARVWSVRKNGLGLMLGMKGDRKPIAFIEDAAVPIKQLPDYIDKVLEICKENETKVAMYAHAGVGLIHVRPILDLRRRDDIDRMKNIARGAFDLVKQYGGSFSGEHGDGRVRSPFIPQYFGDRIYGALKEVKSLFDPDGLMNPGIIIDAGPMDKNLRYGTSYKQLGFATEYHYRTDGGMARAVELCTGVGDCRQTLGGTMCPSYRATRDEEHSTRGRANALRLAMTGQFGPGGLTSKRLLEVFDLCLSCKACKAECPSNVDVARLKSELLQKIHDARGVSLRERLVANSTRTASLFSGWLAPVVNAFQRAVPVRKLLQVVSGIDSRRVLPDYASSSFPRWFAKHHPQNGSRRKVVLFDDTYMNYHEPSVGISAVELLESCGYEVIPARAGCCQRPKISHGFLREARREGEITLRKLDRFIQQGLKIVVCEPGCASALVDDLPDLIDDEALGMRIQENVMMIDAFLAQELKEGRLDCGFTSDWKDILVHGHCHQKALFSRTATQEILERVEGLEVHPLDTGCCGMAGSFGYEKEHYELSMRIGEERLFPTIRNRPEGAAVVASGFSCRHQIAHGTQVKARHFVEVVRGLS